MGYRNLHRSLVSRNLVRSLVRKRDGGDSPGEGGIDDIDPSDTTIYDSVVFGNAEVDVANHTMFDTGQLDDSVVFGNAEVDVFIDDPE